MSHSLETVEIEGRPVNLFVPEGNDPDKRLRTILLLHGMGGDHTRWAENCDLESLVHGKPILLAMPCAGNSFYLDSPAGNMETFIRRDLIGYLDNRFPTVKSPNGRAITGYSMGGYGALILALRNPDLFGSAASHSGAVLTARATHEAGVKWELADTLYGTGKDGQIKRGTHDILTLAQKFLSVDKTTGKTIYSGPRLYLDCGTEDFLYYASRELTQAMRMLHIPYEYHESPGDHDWQYWKRATGTSFQFHFDWLSASS